LPPFLFSRSGGWQSEEEAEIAEIVAGGAGKDRVAELIEKAERIAALEKIFRIEAGILCAEQRVAVGDGTRGGAVAVNAIGSGTQYDDRLARDFFDAVENESGIAASESVAGHGGTEFPVGNKRDGMLGMGAAQFSELREERISGLFHRPIVGGVVAKRETVFGFGDAMSGVKKFVHT